MCIVCMSVQAQETDPLAEQAFSLYEAEDYASAVPLLTEAANKGNAEAQNKLGNCYFYGDGVEQDINEAVRYYRLSAEQGYPNGQLNLGECYFYGDGVEQSFEEALKYFRLAADQEYAPAQGYLGKCYEEGLGVDQDLSEAFKYWQLAADQEDPYGIAALGFAYYFGKGVEQDYVEAARAVGASNFQIIFKHVLPNCLSPILVTATLRCATVISDASSLAFIGLGIPAPQPDWGGMLAEGRAFLRDYPYMVLFPGIAIMVTILALNMLGDGLRDSLDPKLKR